MSQAVPSSPPPAASPPPPRRREKRSRFEGVTVSDGKFQSFVKHQGKRLHLGQWRDEEEAAIARDRAVLALGLGRPLNLPHKSTSAGPATPDELRRAARLREKETNNVSRYMGVTWHARDERWATVVCLPGERRGLLVATFDSERHAALAYDLAIRSISPDTKILNFPESTLPPMSVEAIRREARRLRKERTSSRYRGVMRDPKGTGWIAAVTHQRRHIYVGTFATQRAAALAYDHVARTLHGDAAHLNFDPTTGEELSPRRDVFGESDVPLSIRPGTDVDATALLAVMEPPVRLKSVPPPARRPSSRAPAARAPSLRSGEALLRGGVIRRKRA